MAPRSNPKTRRTLVTLCMASALLAGCGAAPHGMTPALARRAVAPIVRVVTTETIVNVPSAGHAALNLEFSMGSGADWKLQSVDAATADAAATSPLAPSADPAGMVGDVTFTVTGDALAQPLKATVTRQQFLDGKAVIQFNNLPAGQLHIHAEAHDQSGKLLVAANGDGQVVVDQLTVVKLRCEVPAPAAGVGHVRIEMGCWTDATCVQATPAPKPTSFVPAPLDGVKFRSWGDPHEEGANGLKFQNQLAGTFLAIKTLTGDFAVVKRQGPDARGRWPGTSLNNDVAIQSHGDVFAYHVVDHQVLLNGQPIAFDAGAVVGPNGLRIVQLASPKKIRSEFSLTTADGDTVTVDDVDGYLNLTGALSSDRVVHEVTGELGTYNNNTPAMAECLRNGTLASNLDAFLQDWRATPQEALLLGAEPSITIAP